MVHYPAVIRIDHREDKVLHIRPTKVEKLLLHPDNPTRHLHHKAGAPGRGNASADHDFLHAVAQSVADACEGLASGPGKAKTEPVAHFERHDPKLEKLVAGVETIDHPSDGRLVAHARHYFKVTNRMQPL